MNKAQVARGAGTVGVIGGIAQVVYGLLAFAFPYGPDVYYGWDEALWIAASIGMIGAVVGLLVLSAGRPRWLAWVSGVVVIVGVAVRIVASVLIIARAGWDPLPLILLSIASVLLGMAALGVSLIIGKQITGWRAWLPVIVAITGLIVTTLFSVNLFVHFVLLGLWGLTWMLVSAVALSHHAQPSALETSPV